MFHVCLRTFCATSLVGKKGNVESIPALGPAIYLPVTQKSHYHQHLLECHVGNFVELLGLIANILAQFHVTHLLHAPIEDANLP